MTKQRARGTAGDVSAVVVKTPAGAKSAAKALRRKVEAHLDARVALSHNIAVGDRTVDGDGALLATTVFGWSETETQSWWRQPRLALDSPIAVACRFESEPFWCNADGIHTFHPNPKLREIDRSRFEQRAFCHSAIVAPVHLPFGHIGIACFIPNDPERRDLTEDFSAHGPMLGLYARTFIASYVKVMCTPERLPTCNLLTAREVACLKWAAAGKTDDEIALILGVARSTIRFHLINAKRKLNTVNRGQTLFKAAQLGYIALSRTEVSRRDNHGRRQTVLSEQSETALPSAPPR